MPEGLQHRVAARLVESVPPLVVALAVAEVFFKFGSFTLECLAFLAVWQVLGRGYDALLHALRAKLRRPSAV
jgi:hypothetical protein